MVSCEAEMVVFVLSVQHTLCRLPSRRHAKLLPWKSCLIFQLLDMGLQEDEFMMLPVNNVMKDLGSRSELFVSASLCFAGSGAIAPNQPGICPLGL